MSKPRKEPPPWRQGRFTPLRHEVAIGLASSDLTMRACAVFLVIATETWGHPSDRYGVYGRDSAAVSVTQIADTINVHVSTARRGLLELEAKGWIKRVYESSGKRATRWQPTLTPPPVPVEVEPEADVESITDENPTSISDWLARRKADDRRAALDRSLGRQ